ncbi:MAG: SdrD B-like domain-containing protein [Desulfococcaceae bacterium]
MTTADDFQGEAGHQIRVALAAASDSFLDADFGYRRPDLPDVSGTIWNDQNANATAEEEEPPFAEVTVRLVDDSGRIVAETTTDSDGFFRFPDVPPGDYVVTVTDLTGELVGFDRTTPAPSYPISVTDADIPGLDFGFVRERIFGCLGDRVWRDDDGDGVEDPDEPGLPGVRVFLDTDDNGRWDPDREPALVTDENGFYRFTGLPPGDYVVRVDSSTVPAGYVLTGGTDPRRLALEPGQECRNSDFGYQPRFAALGDRVWLDLDENGVQDPDEPGASGVLVRLLDASGDAILAETVTDGSGTYRFDGLSPGTYRIEVALPEDYAFTTPEVGTGLLADVFDSDVDPETGRSGPVVLEGDQWNPHLDAGLVPPGPVAGSIGDRIWYDLDGDGIQDPEEPGVSGAVVRLLDADGDAPLAETVSDGLGRYRFDGLSPGQYLVEFVPPPGFVFSPPGAGDDPALDSDPDPATGRTAPVTLPPGADISALDAGLRVPDVPPALLGDRVWRDDNGDGIQTAGEPGVSGATVILLDADAGAERARIVTDSDGNYRFEGLPPGEYRVRFVRPDGFAFSPAGAGGDPAADSDADPATGEATASLAAGQDRIDLDAGLIPDVPPLTIGDLVWVDANDNGLPDPGEGRAGVRLTLQDADGRVLAETVAGANGDYAFADLPPGDYRVTVDSNTLPPGVVPISDPDGGLDNLADVVNLSGDRLDVDFGYGPDLPPEPTPAPPPVDPTARLGDRVWEDMDGDGIQDEDEPGFPGVTVRLFDAAGTGVLAETVTDADGRYLFFGLTPGAYQVEFARPPGYVFAPQGQTGPGRDSNPDPDTGRTNASLSPGAAVLDVDAGLIPTRRIVLGDFVWRDGNGNGLPDPGEGLGGVRVVLTDGAGAVIAETVTDEAGGYRFPDLPPGDYGVRVDGGTLPDGLEPFVDPEGPADGAARLPDQNADNLDVDFGYRPVGPPPDLGGAVKTAADLDGGELLPGDEIAYAVTLRNEGAGAAREVIYVDTPDPFSRLVPGSVTSERGTVTLGNGPEDFSIRVEIGTLEPGESIRVRYRVTVAADAAPGSWIVNQGMLMAAGRLAEPTEWPVSAPLNDPTVIGPIPGGAPAPAMTFTKSAADLNGAPLRPGDVLEYGFTVRNDGPETAAALMVFDGPPIGTALVPGSATADRGTVVEGNPIEWMVGELGPGEMFQGRFQVIVNAEIAEGAFICNQAALLGDGGLRLESLAPDGGETCLPVAPADVAVPVVRAVKRVADLDGGNFSPGDRVAYRVTLVNPADVPAEGVVFSDPMNGRVPLIPGSVTADRGAVQTGNAPTDTEVRVSVGTMAPGERVDIVLEARISPDAADGEIIPNQGRVEWAGGSAPTDDPATATPDDPTDVVVFRPTGERVPPRGFKTVQGDWPLVSWTLRYENDDDRPMILHVEDPIPEGARIVADSVTATFGTTGVLADPERAVWDGVVPAGGAVEIGYRVRVDDGVFRLDNQACAIWDRDGDGLWTDEPEAGTDWICTDDPTTPTGGDPTVWTSGCELFLGDRVWIDTDADGVCRFGEEPRPDGVRLSLYRDADGDNHFSPGVDPLLETTVTQTRNGVSGVYRFENLCPGDYIVGVDASNFGPGGVLEGMRPTIFGGDPDNDRDDDSNGEDWGGAGVLSPAVSLRWNLEPLDEDGDPLSNLTVDFGFIPPPPAPEECPACGPFKPF